MEFKVIEYERYFKRNQLSGTNTCFLVQDNWDDYGYKTAFSLILFDADGARNEIGEVKIMHHGMNGGYVDFPEGIDVSDTHASLGQDQQYYENLLSLNDPDRLEILAVLRDVVWQEQILDDVREDDAFSTSLCRSVRPRDIKLFISILHEQATLTAFDFDYDFPGEDAPTLEFQVIPESVPPTNIHVIIGRNGVGKSRLLNSISDLLVKGRDKRRGKLTFYSEEEESSAVEGFSGIVTVAFSAFDDFEPPASNEGTRSGIRYNYIGLKKRLRAKTRRTKSRNKSPVELSREFVESVLNCIQSSRRSRWIRAMHTLEDDPVFASWQISEIGELPPENMAEAAEKIFDAASSGHKIVLLTVTRLVELVGERTLVLVDEPESHLHPPLAAAFVRALSDLLVSRNGVGVLATHSPVIVQEVPAECVSLFFRAGDEIRIERPDFETFAGNLGRITRSVFGVEVGESGYHGLISEVIAKSGSLEEVYGAFGDQIGAEGRGLVRSIWRNSESD
ncbi:AAA family ATPase [Phaeobacter marinintestinus]|uniref:AAA family ATPase n=1 Tax=Falsiphaeobacter marinintestinus TaxID=1492905 RepID=UPI0011B76CA7|nr:AAA family ATPase [Phaeobacter marinintestinus]